MAHVAKRLDSGEYLYRGHRISNDGGWIAYTLGEYPVYVRSFALAKSAVDFMIDSVSETSQARAEREHREQCQKHAQTLFEHGYNIGTVADWRDFPDWWGGLVYVLQNKANDKLYVGQTENLRGRMQSHASRFRIVTAIERAIAKYGPDAFDVIVVQQHTDDKEEREGVEAFLIEHLNTLASNKAGYNAIPRGDRWTRS